MREFYIFPVPNLSVELMKYEEVGRVRLFVGNRGSGRAGSMFRRVGSGPRKVTRGQLCLTQSYGEITKSPIQDVIDFAIKPIKN